ncbi:MAG: phosphatidate cytidylyltransferase [Tissierellia bacterium]|nr:phosphatidate cytidylyltransferase [Tissierellia bacterium]
MNSFVKRTITYFALAVALVLLLWMPRKYFAPAILLLALELIRELSNGFNGHGNKIPKWILYFACCLQFGLFLLELPLGSAYFFTVLILFGHFLWIKSQTFEDLLISIFIVTYVPFFLFPIIHLRDSYYLYLVFLISITTDTAAYLVGSAIGRHKLIPWLSPNKSVEGAIAGIVATTLLGSLFLWYFQVPLSPILVLFLAIAAICGELGDLFASKIKRELGIKDFGNMLPGHGGFLDRMDSILFIIPLVYFIYHAL